MDTINIKAPKLVGDIFEVQWQWLQGSTSHPIAGVVTVSLGPQYQQDRAVIAELRAIYHLLEDRHIHGENRLGNGLQISVSSGAIRKALLKGSLKSKGIGKTQKGHIAACADFLATKYFEADISVNRWKDMEPKAFEESAVDLNGTFPRPLLNCGILGEQVSVSRHAMLRCVGRIDQRKNRHDEDELGNVPDARWSAAWRWFQRVLSNENLELAQVRPECRAKMLAKHGQGAKYIRFPDAQSILVFQRSSYGVALATVLRDDAYSNLLEKQAYVVGQRIVRGHIHERTKANRPSGI